MNHLLATNEHPDSVGLANDSVIRRIEAAFGGGAFVPSDYPGVNPPDQYRALVI